MNSIVPADPIFIEISSKLVEIKNHVFGAIQACNSQEQQEKLAEQAEGFRTALRKLQERISEVASAKDQKLLAEEFLDISQMLSDDLADNIRKQLSEITTSCV